MKFVFTAGEIHLSDTWDMIYFKEPLIGNLHSLKFD
jgi:hypothetical protein